MMATPQRLVPLLEAALQSSRFVLEDVVVTAAGRRSVVRVVVDLALAPGAGDSPDTTMPAEPLSLDDVADATQMISAALDADDVMGESAYTLEVTSPGISRPLTQPRHFRRNIGRLVTLVGPGETVTGRLVRAGDEECVVERPVTKKDPGGPLTVRYDDIARGEVQIEFNRPDADVDTSDSDQTEEN